MHWRKLRLSGGKSKTEMIGVCVAARSSDGPRIGTAEVTPKLTESNYVFTDEVERPHRLVIAVISLIGDLCRVPSSRAVNCVEDWVGIFCPIRDSNRKSNLGSKKMFMRSARFLMDDDVAIFVILTREP